MIMRARDATGALVDLNVASSGMLQVETTAPTTTTTAFNAVSVAASGTADSATVDGTDVTRARVVIDSSGANITVSLQSSADGGTTWHDVDSYAAGVTGVQAVVELPGTLLRLRAANAGVGAESVTAHLVTGRA